MAVDRIRLTDLERPRMPWPIRAANALPASVARRLVSLDEQSVMAAARKRTGLEDFGDERFRTALRVFLRAAEEEARLSTFGRVATRGFAVQLLSNRLLVEDQIRRHPEILDTPVERPIIIAGLPRTGTTHLHNLMSADPNLRSLPYWESLEPVPLPKEAATARPEDDPRWKRCAKALEMQDWMMPEFKRMHEMEPDAVHEEIQLLGIDFSTMLFETSHHAPSYREWYCATDQTETYRYLYRVLQVLQFLREGGKRWVLKSPQHLEQLKPLIDVFPDATVIQTHRDPLSITKSLLTMLAYGSRINEKRVDLEQLGREWSKRVEDLLRGSIEGRRHVPESQRMDVHFDEFMKDDVAMVERVYAFAGQPWSAETQQAIREYMDTHPRGRYGAVEYHLDEFGLDAAERRESLRFYSDHFDVTLES